MVYYAPVIGWGYHAYQEYSQRSFINQMPTETIDQYKDKIEAIEKLEKIEDKTKPAAFLQTITAIFFMCVFKYHFVLVGLAAFSVVYLGINLFLLDSNKYIYKTALKLLDIFNKNLEAKLKEVEAHLKQNPLIFENGFSHHYQLGRETLLTPIVDAMNKLYEDSKIFKSGLGGLLWGRKHPRAKTPLYQPHIDLSAELLAVAATCNHLMEVASEYVPAENGGKTWEYYFREEQLYLKQNQLATRVKEFSTAANTMIQEVAD